MHSNRLETVLLFNYILVQCRTWCNLKVFDIDANIYPADTGTDVSTNF